MDCDALRLLTRHSGRVARWCGFPLLDDELHEAWLRDMILGEGDMTLLAHRASYKTTCLSMAMAVLLCVKPADNMIFLRKTDDDVVEVLRQVRKILQADAMRLLTSRLYGAPVRAEKSGAWETTTNCYAAPRGAPQLLGLGIGSSITGKHADILLTDDIVNLRDRVSKPERDRTREMYMELQNIRNRGGRIINTGTPWHRDDAIALMPAVRRYDCYRTGLIAPEKLELLRASMSPSLFAANYELRLIAQEGALFPEAPPQTEDAGLLADGIAHIDASYGGEDCTALTCGRRTANGLVLYGRLWRAHVDTVLDEALACCDRLRCAPILCETNGDKGYLGAEIRRRDFPVRLYRENANKYVKISSYLRKWWSHVTFLSGTDPDYLAQILDYTDTAVHDDAPDSAACLCRALDRR